MSCSTRAVVAGVADTAAFMVCTLTTHRMSWHTGLGASQGRNAGTPLPHKCSSMSSVGCTSLGYRMACTFCTLEWQTCLYAQHVSRRPRLLQACLVA